MMITFNGRDLVTRFKEDPENQAIRGYKIEYECGFNTVTHYVNAEDSQGEDDDGNRLYRDVLTYAENENAGLTRTPQVYLSSQNADMRWSDRLLINAQNPIPVLGGTPKITSTITGIEIALVIPTDSDFEGVVAWTHSAPGFPLTSAYERYRGKAGTISLQLPTNDTYYLRICPYDAFGLDLSSAWDEIPVKRKLLGNEIVESPPWQQLPNLVGELLERPIDDLSALTLDYGAAITKASKALSDKNLVAIRTLETRVEEDGSKVAEEILTLTSRVTEAEKAVANVDVSGPIEAGLQDIRRTIANTEFALSEEINTKIARFGDGVEAAFNEERRVRTEEKLALAEDISQMDTRITTEVDGVKQTMEGTFNDLRQLIIDAENGTALALRIDEMGVRITEEVGGEKTAREAAIRDVQKAIVDGDKATAERVDTLSSSVNGILEPGGPVETIKAAIETIKQTEADNNGARAREISTLQSEVSGLGVASLRQELSTYANKVDGIGAQYVLKLQTDVNGQKYVAGMGLAIDNGISAIAFSADSFRMLVPGQTGNKQIFYADANGIYAPDLTVERLKVNTAVIPVRAYAATDVNGQFYNWPYSAPNATQTVLATSIYMPVAGWLECQISAKQHFTKINGNSPWCAAIAVDGFEIPESLIYGTIPGDTPMIFGTRYVNVGWHTVEFRWDGNFDMILRGRTLYVKGFPSTS